MAKKRATAAPTPTSVPTTKTGRAVVISSGHGKYVRGASGYLDEVDEARRVVDRVAELLEAAGVRVDTFHDNTSYDQSTNLSTIVNYHNSHLQPHDLDVSVHFNAYNTTSSPMGTETLYTSSSGQSIAVATSPMIAAAGGFIDRGPKKRTDLYFLNNTNEVAILIEVCFVDSRADADLYHENFEDICHVIAEAVSGVSIADQPPPDRPDWQPPDIDWPPGGGTDPPPDPGEPVPPAIGTVHGLAGDDRLNIRASYSSDSPVIGRAENNDLLTVVGSAYNGDTQWLKCKWGDDHMAGIAVYGWASSNYVRVDGEIPGPPFALSPQDQDAIAKIAEDSVIFDYQWRDRGLAPPGYTKGMALSFASSYLKLMNGHAAVADMAKARTDSDKDALNIYRSQFQNLGMSNEVSGPDTLRHLYALLLGHGMRESSGRHCEGRDQSADNVQSDTAEAGLFQTSYNAHSASDPEFDDLMVEYGDSANQATCYLPAYEEGVSCSSSEWSCYGSGVGYDFQKLCKECPSFAVESCLLTLRNLANHYGPIIREESELKSDAEDMFKQVQDYIDNRPVA